MKVATKVNKIISKLESDKIYDYSLFDDIENRNALYVSINRLLSAKKIQRIGKGKFCITINNSTPSKYLKEEEILNNGVEIGQGLYYKLGLSAEKPLYREIATPNVRSKYFKTLFKTRIKYTPLKQKNIKNSNSLIELLDVLENREKILNAKEEKVDLYIYIQSINIAKDEILFSEFSKLLSDSYGIIKKIEILTKLEKINPSFTKRLSTFVLKRYQAKNLNKAFYNKTKSRIFILLNRNIAEEFKYSKIEVFKALKGENFGKKTAREKSILSKIFREFDSYDLKLLQKDFYINIEKLRKTFLSSPYKDTEEIYNNWKECLGITNEFVQKSPQEERKISNRLKAILEKRNRNV